MCAFNKLTLGGVRDVMTDEASAAARETDGSDLRSRVEAQRRRLVEAIADLRRNGPRRPPATGMRWFWWTTALVFPVALLAWLRLAARESLFLCERPTLLHWATGGLYVVPVVEGAIVLLLRRRTPVSRLTARASRVLRKTSRSMANEAQLERDLHELVTATVKIQLELQEPSTTTGAPWSTPRARKVGIAVGVVLGTLLAVLVSLLIALHTYRHFPEKCRMGWPLARREVTREEHRRPLTPSEAGGSMSSAAI